MGFTACRVTGQYLTPNKLFATGSVKFTLVSTMIDGTDKLFVAAEPVYATLNGFGFISGDGVNPYITLYCNDDSTTSPVGTYYMVEERIGTTGPGQSFTTYDVVIPSGTPSTPVSGVANTVTVDLADLNHFSSQGGFSGTLSDETFVRTQRLDQLASPAAGVNWNGQLLSNLGSGAQNSDAANLSNVTQGWSAFTQLGTFTNTSTTITASNLYAYAPYVILPGMRLTWTESGTAKYAIVAYLTGTNPYTINFVGNTMGTPDNNSLRYCYAGGIGFPGSFSWTPSNTGYSTQPGTPLCWFSVHDRICFLNYLYFSNGISNATTYTVAAPIPAAATAAATGLGVNNGSSGSAYNTMIGVVIAGSTITLQPQPGGGSWASGGSAYKNAAFQLAYPI